MDSHVSLRKGIVAPGLDCVGRSRVGVRRPSDRRVNFRFDCLEDRRLLSGISNVTEYTVPTPSANLQGIALGPDGNLWFTEFSADRIGMINPTTHAITEFNVPTASAEPRGITAGPDGNLWFTEQRANKIGMINTTTHAITEFTVPSTNAYPVAITAGPDGNVWFTTLNYGDVWTINPTTHVVTEFAIPEQARMGITTGPDGNIWYTEIPGIGMINPTTHAAASFSGSAYTPGIVSGPDGNVWFTVNQNPSFVGLINPATDAITEFSTPTANASPEGMTAGPDGNLWFAESAGNIASINPTTDAITEFPVPFSGSSPGAITTGPDGNLWFTDATNAIGVATLATSQLVVTAQPPSSVTAGSGFGLTVQAEDSAGNLITSFNGTVTVGLGSNPGGATLGGTLSVTASGGVATFSGLTLNKAASGYTLVVSSSGIGEGASGSMTVTPAAASQLVITQQPPATVKVSSAFGLQASIEDQYGNVVTTASNTVSVAFGNNPTGATLGGTLSATASQGVATFSNLTINKTGSGYTLKVSSSGLSSAVTSAISVTKTGRAPVPLTAPTATPVPDSLLGPLLFDSPDLWTGLVPKKRFRS